MASPRDIKAFLDDLDRRLLTRLDLHPVEPVTALAEALDTSPRTLSRRLSRLREHGVIKIVGRTLPSFEGQIAWLIRAEGESAHVLKACEYAATYPKSRWVRQSLDSREFLSGLVDSPEALERLLLRLARDFHLTVTGVHELMQVFSAPEHAVTRSEKPLDALDRRLLAELAADGRAESSHLATILRTDPSTVSRRKRRLLEEGVLYFEADIHPAALGAVADSMVWVSMRPGGIGEVGRALRHHSSVRFVAMTSGKTQLAVNVVQPDSESLTRFLDAHLAHPDVQGLEVARLRRVFKRNA